MQNGGRRQGAGRTRTVLGFREWCRSVVDSPKVREAMAAAALKDPDFALKLSEHGYGRPPQSLDVNVNPGGGAIEHRVCFADGNALSAAAVPIPAGASGGSKA